jgi:hypothetical protein
MRALCVLPLLGLACSALTDLDKGSLTDTGDTGPLMARRVSISFSVALQRGWWGGELNRCQVQVAFNERGQGDGLFRGAGAVIAHPSEPGTCAYTDFEDDEQAAGLWSVRGTRRADETIWLHGPEASLPLELGQDSSGRYTYDLIDCDEASFPFAQPFDLEVPGWEGADGMEGFEIEQALVTGPDMHIDSISAPEGAPGRRVLARGEDLSVSWSYEGDPEEVAGLEIAHTPYLMLRNTRQGEEATFEALSCLPSTWGEATVSAEDLALLEHSDDVDEADPYIAFQIDAWYGGPEFATPWHETSRVLSMVTEGGTLILAP